MRISMASLLTQFRRSQQYYLTVIFSLTLTLVMLFSVFSIIDAVYLKPLPYKDTDRLFYVEGVLEFSDGASGRQTNTRNMVTLQQQAQSLSDLAIYFNWSEYKLYDFPSRSVVPVYMASENLFSLLGVEPIHGRVFDSREQLGNKQPSALISYRVWQEKFNGDSNIIGRNIQLNMRRFTVVGVLPDNLVLPDKKNVSEAIWLPLDMDEWHNPKTFGGYAGAVKGLGRLAEDVTLHQAQERLSEQMRQAALINTPAVLEEFGVSAAITPFDEALRGGSRNVVLMLIGGVTLLTLIALINLGNLQLGRAAGRVQTVAVCYAFGATQRQLFLDVFRHNVSVIGCAALAAIGLTQLLFNAIKHAGGQVLPRMDVLSISLLMCLFAIAITLLIALLFSYIELRVINESQLRNQLQSSGKGTGKQMSKSVSHSLIGLQVLFSVLTLAASSQVLMVSLTEALRPTGITTDNLWSLNVNYGNIEDRQTRVNIQRSMAQYLDSVSGVEMVTASSGKRLPEVLNVDIVTDDKGEAVTSARQVWVDDAHLQLFGTAITGRYFTRDDMDLAHSPVIINERFAEKLSGKAIGQKLILRDQSVHQIIGVVSNTWVPGASFLENDELFLPRRYQGGRFSSFTIKVQPGFEGFSHSQLYQALLEIDPRIDLVSVTTLADDFDELSKNQRFAAWLAGSISLASLLMVLAGIGGMVSYMVQMGRYDLGVKMAMGATSKHLLKNQLLELAKPVAMAALLAFSLAYFLLGYSRTLPQWFFTIHWSELLLALALMLMFTAAVCFVPVWKVLVRDPIKALRND